jgi:hypothetical protein
MTDKKKVPLQIYLREDQIKVLKVIAERRGKSMAALVRQGVDLLLDDLPADEDPLLEILGLFASDQGDLAEKHDQYLSQAISQESEREA